MSSHRRTGTDAAPTFRSALHHRDFRLLLLGHGAGTIAQLMMMLAVGIEALARSGGARQLYVSATPSESAVGFYRSRGFIPTVTPIPELLEHEPEDVHMTLAL